ncbi:MAG: hypothetical protein EBR82_80205 [Caulobacteraceae bacterium]|nr:hypothetical protein [Caulobacteraceae bacterium]
MIARSTDFERADEIINDPSVFPWVSFDTSPDRLTVEHLVRDTRNVLMLGDAGGFLLACKNKPQTSFDLHTFYLPEGRGRGVHDDARVMFQFMFCETSAHRIYTMVPDDAPHARPPLSFGWRPCFTRNDLFVRNGKSVGAQFWRLDFWDWAYKQKALSDQSQVLTAVSKHKPAKARYLAQEWAEWSGELIECQ